MNTWELVHLENLAFGYTLYLKTILINKICNIGVANGYPSNALPAGAIRGRRGAITNLDC